MCEVESTAWAKACSLEDGLCVLGGIRPFSWQETRVGVWKRECHRRVSKYLKGP